MTFARPRLMCAMCLRRSDPDSAGNSGDVREPGAPHKGARPHPGESNQCPPDANFCVVIPLPRTGTFGEKRYSIIVKTSSPTHMKRP
eukprot:1088639-Alexandrium_andersonii.AAC.1